MWTPYLYGFKLKPIPKLRNTVPPKKDDWSEHPRLWPKPHCPLTLVCHMAHVKDLLPILIANFNQAHYFHFRPGCYDITFTPDPKYVKLGHLSNSSGTHKSLETTQRCRQGQHILVVRKMRLLDCACILSLDQPVTFSDPLALHFPPVLYAWDLHCLWIYLL